MSKMRTTSPIARGISFLTVAMCLCLAGCNKYTGRLLTKTDSARHPQKSDPVFVLSIAQPNGEDWALEQKLRGELRRNHFKIAERPQDATWLLKISVRGEADPENNGDLIYVVHLSALPVSGPNQTQASPAWEGSMAAKPNVYKVFPETIVKELLDEFGLDSDDEQRLLDKRYQRSV